MYNFAGVLLNEAKHVIGRTVQVIFIAHFLYESDYCPTVAILFFASSIFCSVEKFSNF